MLRGRFWLFLSVEDCGVEIFVNIKERNRMDATEIKELFEEVKSMYALDILELKTELFLSNCEIRESVISVLIMVEAIKQMLALKWICTSEEMGSLSKKVKELPEFKKVLDVIQKRYSVLSTTKRCF